MEGSEGTPPFSEGSEPTAGHEPEQAASQTSRRQVMKWGLFTTAAVVAPLGALSPFVRFAFGAEAPAPAQGKGDLPGVPTGLPPSPTFGVAAFSQPLPRFDVLARNPVSTLSPAPTAQSNQTQQPVDPKLVGGRTGGAAGFSERRGR